MSINPESKRRAVTLLPGDPAPLFEVPAHSNPRFQFHTVAGRPIVLSFLGSAGTEQGAAFLTELGRVRRTFDDDAASIFLVTSDPEDKELERLSPRIPGIRIFWDFERTVATLYGVASDEATGGYRPTSVVLDDGLRVLGAAPINDARAHMAWITATLAAAPKPQAAVPLLRPAPILIVPGIFERAFCGQLMTFFRDAGGAESGFMVEEDGKTVTKIGHHHKRRTDALIPEGSIREAINVRLLRRLVPAVERAYQFRATRIERYIVARYDADGGGYFRPHRDNTTKGTAHRRFAVSVNLNSEDYAGGDLCFPEYGRHSYRPPTGGALVFSCSILHEVIPMERGERFVFLPFLYDDAAAAVRQANLKYVATDDDAPR